MATRKAAYAAISEKAENREKPWRRQRARRKSRGHRSDGSMADGGDVVYTAAAKLKQQSAIERNRGVNQSMKISMDQRYISNAIANMCACKRIV